MTLAPWRCVWLVNVALGISLLPFASGSDLVQWTDEKGVLHFSDSLENVPPRYRDQVKLDKLKDNPLPQRSRVEGASALRTNEPVTEQLKLKSYEVPFEAYEGTAQRVIVSVTFNDTVTARMAIDTGAPGLVISPKIASQLGLFHNDEGRVVIQSGGIGGRVPAIKTFIDKVQVGDASDTFIPATVVRSISSSFEGLLGMDFMSKYAFKIDSVKHVVIFDELRPNPEWPGGRPEQWWRNRFRELHNLREAWLKVIPREHWHAQYAVGKFASQQVTEVDKLLDKLDRHANYYSVPQTWR